MLLASEGWLKRRKHTTVGFFLCIYFLGVEYTATLPTMWLYMRCISARPQLYFTLAASMYAVANVTASFFVARFVDRHRCNRAVAFTCNALIICGNLCYTVSASPWCAVIGRTLAGCGGPLRSVIYAETARIYVGTSYTRMVSFLGLAFSLGYITAPCFNFVFSWVDVTLVENYWRIDSLNAVGLFTALFFLVLQVITYYSIYDLSKEFDLKSENYLEDDVNKGEFNDYSRWQIVKKLILNFDVLLIMLASMFTYYSSYKTDVWIPVLANGASHYSATQINLIFIGIGVVSIITLVSFAYFKPPENTFYTLSAIGMAGWALMEVYFMLIYNVRISTVQTLVWLLQCTCFGMLTLTEEVFFVYCVANLVPSEIQNTAESTREVFETAGTFAAMMSSVWTVRYVNLMSPVLIALALSTALVFFVRRNHRTKVKFFTRIYNDNIEIPYETL